MAQDSKLRDRLEKIWENPDLYSFFQKYSKRPAHLVKKGTIIFNSGDPLNGIYFIKEGFIKLYEISPDGKETIIYLTGPGSLLGLRALISKAQTAHQFTQALTDVQMYNMTHKEYFEVLKEHPEFLIDLVHIFIDRLNHAERRVEGFVANDATTRVAWFLLDCALRFGKKPKADGDRLLLPLPLTHQRIGEFIGAFRETVTLAMNRLEKEKIITNQRGQVTILDMRKLKKRALVA